MLTAPQEPLGVAHLVAGPSQRAHGRLVVAETQDGTPIRVPVVVIRGSEPGPVLYVQAASDGDELNGLGVLHRFLRQVRGDRLRGGIIAVPVANVDAFNHRQAHSPVDGRKLNRCFPRRPDGTSSERIAHVLFESIVVKADYCVDLHQGGIRPMIDEVRVRTPDSHSLHDACLEMAMAFGAEYILDEPGPEGQLARAAADRGIPAIDPELGGCVGWDESSIEIGLRGLWNLLYYCGLACGAPLVPEEQIVVSGFETVLAGRGGVIEYCAALRDRVDAGQEVAHTYDLFGQKLDTLTAPVTGIVWSLSPYPAAATGEPIMTIVAHPRTVSPPPQSGGAELLSDGVS